MLNIVELKKNFGNREILKELNLMINEGSVFGLVGINGAGKSTLLRCISGVYEPDGGFVTFEGQDTFNSPEIRKDILYVSDDVYFPVNSSIETMKTYYSSFYQVDNTDYYHYLEMFGLNEKALISSFSKGMKRQVSLLFAMCIKPKLLLLDECFDGLDPLIRLSFKKALVEMLEENRITVIISSHNLKELEDICDSFGILENGRISTYGDLLESKENIVKFQIVFNDETDEDFFDEFDVLSYKKEGRVINVVIKGNIDKVREKIENAKPLLMDELTVNFEEMFIYEVESRGLLR